MRFPFQNLSRFIGSTCLAVLLAACGYGDDFDEPLPGWLKLGITTKSDVRSAYGEPRFDPTSEVRNGRRIDSWTYGYSLTLNQFNTLGRSLVVMFDEDKLVAWSFNSEFSEEIRSIDFAAGVERLQRGGDCSSVEAVMGFPSGMASFPVAMEPGSLIYAYTMPGRAFVVKCDADGRITQTRYAQGEFAPFGVFQ